jgi:sugar lactone lactonase YvrE
MEICARPWFVADMPRAPLRSVFGLVVCALFGCSEDTTLVLHDSVMDAGTNLLIDASLGIRFSEIGAVTKISDQFWFTEGPVWDPVKSVLYFTDVNVPQPDGGVGAIYRLTLPDKVDLFYQPTGSADGLALDTNHNLVVAGYGSRSVWQLDERMTRSTRIDCVVDAGVCRPGQVGEPLNTPDDLAVRSDGTLYFTDPTFGQALAQGPFSARAAQGVYRLSPDGVLHLEDQSLGGPNGISFSPDEKTLYVSYTTSGSIAAFSVAADGSLSGKTTFASALTPDSMCVDAQGNVYVATLFGISVFAPQGGMSIGTIPVAGDVATNCAFGGADQKTLFITSHSALTLIAAPTKPGSSLSKIEQMPVPGLPGRN